VNPALKKPAHVTVLTHCLDSIELENLVTRAFTSFYALFRFSVAINIKQQPSYSTR